MPTFAARAAAFALLVAAIPGASATVPKWMSLPPAQPPEAAHSAYYDFATKNLNPRFDPKYVLAFSKSSRTFSAIDGDLYGDWTFFGRVGDRLPRSAQRVQVSRTPPYHVTVDRYCEEGDCANMEKELARMPAPRPAGGEALLADWRRIVANEQCDRLLPVTTPDPALPPEEMWRGITGDVTVKAFHNRCGDIRDAMVVHSSGNRNLDRAALKQALRWRVANPQAAAGWSLQILRFTLTNPRNPTMSAPLEAYPAPGARIQAGKR